MKCNGVSLQDMQPFLSAGCCKSASPSLPAQSSHLAIIIWSQIFGLAMTRLVQAGLGCTLNCSVSSVYHTRTMQDTIYSTKIVCCKLFSSRFVYYKIRNWCAILLFEFTTPSAKHYCIHSVSANVDLFHQNVEVPCRTT